MILSHHEPFAGAFELDVLVLLDDLVRNTRDSPA
jgi:hypothetical protein